MQIQPPLQLRRRFFIRCLGISQTQNETTTSCSNAAEPRIKIKWSLQLIGWEPEANIKEYIFLKRFLKSSLHKVFARLDLSSSKEEQEQDFVLRKELKQMFTRNPGKKFKIYIGKV